MLAYIKWSSNDERNFWEIHNLNALKGHTHSVGYLYIQQPKEFENLRLQKFNDQESCQRTEDSVQSLDLTQAISVRL